MKKLFLILTFLISGVCFGQANFFMWHSTQELPHYDVVTLINSQTFSAGIVIKSIEISADGNYFYILVDVNAQASELRRYQLNTPYLISTISTTYQVLQLPFLYNGDTSGSRALYIKPNGVDIYLVYSYYVRHILLNTQDDLTSWSTIDNHQIDVGANYGIGSIWVSSNYITTSINGRPIRLFSTSPPYGFVSYTSYSQTTYTYYKGLEYSTDMSSFYIMSSFDNAVLEKYNNVSYSSPIGSWNISGTLTNPWDFCFSDNLLNMYVLSGTTSAGYTISQFGLPAL